MFELHQLSALEQGEWVRSGRITPRELVEHYLARIERLNPSIGAFSVVEAERALTRADTLVGLGARSAPLFGIPFADKELVERAGQRTTFGSRLFADYVSTTSDELVEQLDAAGAISLGATAAPEFGLSSYTEGRGLKRGCRRGCGCRTTSVRPRQRRGRKHPYSGSSLRSRRAQAIPRARPGR